MSDLEETLLFQLRVLNLPLPVRELRFAPPRKWRFDFAWPSVLLACEIEGGVWTGGRHSRGVGFTADCLKYNAAALLNQTSKDWHTRGVTLNEVKGLALRFFAALRMTRLGSHMVKCTNVLHSGLGWKVLRFTSSMIESGEALTIIEHALHTEKITS